MTILATDRPKFAKLGVADLLGLALYAPYRYDDLCLRSELTTDKPMLLDATIDAIDLSPKRLMVRIYAHNIARTVDVLYFSPKGYLKEQFLVGARRYFFGRLSLQAGRLQLSHPTLPRQIGAIIPRYKSLLAERSLRLLIERYLTLAELEKTGLPPAIANALYAIHFPLDAQPDELTPAQIEVLKYTEIFRHLKVLHAKKRHFPAIPLATNDYLSSWIATLPFKLTADQLRVIGEIKADLQRPVATRRLIVGDVGCGKTMVMLAAAQMALPHRSLLMAPTSVLADQLYREACRFLPDLPVALVTGKKYLSNYQGSLDEAKLIIGTHALLHRELPPVALLMIDEQHRFGTKQRHQLIFTADKENRTHTLQFSATPIPRTQAMIASALVDLSTIRQLPFAKKITTRIISRPDFPALLAHIDTQIKADRQVAIIYPLVDESEHHHYQSLTEGAPYWQQRYEGVFVVHGRQKEKDEILQQFAQEGKILLATTVIEVGISLPRLSTIVIVGAERLGLATLHQLRGRVSRNGLDGYCFLYTHNPNNERLASFAATTDGFAIAELDLKLRHSGDLVGGHEQSGREYRWFDPTADEAILARAMSDLKLKMD
ncbi:MAG: ATP-dependent DNA helicase RecG [Campylobacterales bacterium]